MKPAVPVINTLRVKNDPLGLDGLGAAKRAKALGDHRP